MELVINGERKVLDVGTVYEVIDHYGLSNKTIVAEVDGVVLDKEQWASTAIKQGMKIELVHFVGGG